VEDLYADDLAFRVFSRSDAFPPEQAFDFFLGWINDKSASSRNSKAVWLNIGIMLNNCFALSNMIRHNVPDVKGQAENKVQRFLSRADARMRKEFTYFKDFMTNMKEDVTEKEFEENLKNYLMKTAELAD
jgi:hypothetical protein